MNYKIIWCVCLLVISPVLKAADNVVLVTLDGLRWQELFHGLDNTLLKSIEHPTIKQQILSSYSGSSSEDKRSKLMPFVWSDIAKQGVMIGDQHNNSVMKLTNNWWFSYPGYNEILTGSVDDSINSNEAKMNQNVTILEWLANQTDANNSKKYHVAAFASWDVFPAIINTQRNKFVVNAGFTPANWAEPSPKAQWLGQLQASTPSPWHNVRLDAFTMGFASEYIKAEQPNVIYVSLGETDDFAHDGDYAQYLKAATRSDQLIQQLWTLLQSIPQYKNNTNLIITTDHGRGKQLDDWQHHASPQAVSGYMSELLARFPLGIVDADSVWMMALGPDFLNNGLVTTTTPATLDQIAATVLVSLNETPSDYSHDIAPALHSIMMKKRDDKVMDLKTDKVISRIGFGSCAHEDKAQPIWSKVLEKRPELFVLMGDNIYGDTEDMDILKAKYAKFSQKPGFKALRTNTPVIGIWDDHDFGVNDGGAEYPMKAASKKIMLDFFGEATDSLRRQQKDGAYTSYMIGQPGQQVHIILPDLRYNRTPLNSVGKIDYLTGRVPKNMGPYSPNLDSLATMLGETQWQWLESELAKPADIKILISSIQLLSDFTGWESWANYPTDQTRLFDLIKRLNLKNLMILSGDTHWSELTKRKVGEYELLEITSSGITEKWKEISPNQYRVSEAFAEANFGMLEIQWDNNPISAEVKIINNQGDTLISTHWLAQ